MDRLSLTSYVKSMVLTVTSTMITGNEESSNEEGSSIIESTVLLRTLLPNNNFSPFYIHTVSDRSDQITKNTKGTA